MKEVKKSLHVSQSHRKNHKNDQQYFTNVIVQKSPNFPFHFNNNSNHCWIIEEKTIEQLQNNNNIKYLGEVENHIPNGFGILISKEYEYKGYWINGIKNGWGIYTQINKTEIIEGFFDNDNIKGYCRKTITLNNSSYTIIGEVNNTQFQNTIVIHNKKRNLTFEGELRSDDINKEEGISIGKLFDSNKLNQEFYLGEVQHYKRYYGNGIIIKKGSHVYLGEFKDKKVMGYIEMFFSNGFSLITHLSNGVKNGYCFLYHDDGKVFCGKYHNNFKHGPFFQFSNSNNIQKSNIKMELFLYGYKCKIINSYDNGVKYLNEYYPEFADVSKICKQELLKKIGTILKENKKEIDEYIQSSIISKDDLKKDSKDKNEQTKEDAHESLFDY